MIDAIGLGPAELAYCAAALFGAGVVRGYSGFGLSALVMTSLALVMPPAQIVPITLVLEVFATLVLYRGIRGHVVWRLLLWLLLGAAVATPVGLIFLQRLSADVVRLVLAAFILCACFALWRQAAQHKWVQGPVPAFLTGIISGIANGVAAVGGLPAVIFLVAAIPHASAFRASAMAYLLLLNIYGFSATYVAGLVDGQALMRLVLFAIPALLGVLVGHRHFLSANPESFRRFAIGLLAVLAIIVIIRAVVF